MTLIPVPHRPGSRIGILLGLGMAAALAMGAQVSAEPKPLAQFQPSFTAELDRHGVVGGAFSLVSAGRPTAELFHGLARVNGAPINAQTAYNWASITKTMTAIAILQLRDHGRLSLDDPAVLYVPELRQVHDAFGPIDKITIRDLLTHSAGFRNPTWPWDCDDPEHCDWQPFEPTRWSQVAAMLPFTHVAFTPGSRWSYSNLGYVFLGQIIERVSGDDFEVYLEKNILRPLDMRESYFDVAPYFLESHVSASYLRAGVKLSEQPLNFDTGVTTSNSGLKAPVPDMEKYLRFLIGEPGNTRYEQVLRRATLEEMWTGVVPVTEPGQAPTAYTATGGGSAPKMGLGFFVQQTSGRRYIYHDGDQGGFSAELLFDPDSRTGAVLIVNTTDTGAPPAADTGRPQTNTEPDPTSDLRVALRETLLKSVFTAPQAKH